MFPNIILAEVIMIGWNYGSSNFDNTIDLDIPYGAISIRIKLILGTMQILEAALI